MVSGNNQSIPEHVVARIRSKLVVSETGCWQWPGTVNEHGYGRVTWTEGGEPRRAYVHRAIWLAEVGRSQTGSSSTIDARTAGVAIPCT